MAEDQSIPKGQAFQSFQNQRTNAQQKIDGVLHNNRIRGQWVGFLIMLLLAVGVFWSSQTTLDEIAIAEGTVIPADKIKVVQHLEGGILEKILITEGDLVTVGQELFHLDLGTSGLDPERLNTELQSLLIMRHRARTEASEATEIVFPDDQIQSSPDIVLAEEQLFYSNRRVLKSAIDIHDSQLLQKKSARNEVLDRIKSLEDQRRGQQELHEILGLQLQGGSVSKVEFLESELKIKDIEGQIQQVKQSRKRIAEEIAEIGLAQEQEREKFRIRALFDLEEAEEKIAAIRQTLKRAGAQQNRAVITSPITGIVKSLRYNTIGNVIQPAEVLAEIVPKGNNLLIEAKLKPIDRGFVAVGQSANIKIGTYEFSRYGGIEGEVALLSASSTTSQDGLTYFEIQVRPEKAYLGDNPNALVISPGMQATVDIHTGQRTVLDFLLKPILKIRDEAFRER